MLRDVPTLFLRSMLISGAIDFCILLERSPSRPLGQWSASAIPVADVHEIAAGKLCAALERHHSRDLYDVHLSHQSEWLDFDSCSWLSW